MATRVERQLAADDRRLALHVVAFARQFAAPQQRADAFDQQTL